MPPKLPPPPPACPHPERCFIIRRPADAGVGGLALELHLRPIGVSVSLHLTFTRRKGPWLQAKTSKPQ